MSLLNTRSHSKKNSACSRREVMKDKGARRFPVVDPNGKLSGLF